MAKTPKINPQEFSKRSASTVPQLSGSTANLRSTPSVTSFAQDSLTNTYLAMADDSQKLGMAADNLFNFGQSQFDHFQSQVKEQQMIEAEGELNKVIIESEGKIDQIKSGSNIDDITRDSVKAYDETSSEIMDKASLSTFQRNYLAPKIDKLRTTTAQNSLSFQNAARREESRFTIEETIQTREFLAKKNPERLPDLISEIDDQVAALGAGLTESERRTLGEKQKERLAMAAASSEIETNPELAKAKLESGYYNSMITLDQTETLLADAEIKKAKNKAQADSLATKQRGAVDAQLSVSIAIDPADKLPNYTDLDSLRNSGKISDTQWEGLSKSLSVRFKEEVKKQKSLQLGETLVTSKIPVNPNNKEAVDAFNEYYDSQQENIAQLPPAQRVRYSADLIATSRAVPKMLQGEVELAARSGDASQVALVADLIDTVGAETPYLMDQLVSTKDRQRIDMINRRINAGVEPKEAIAQTDQQLSIIAQVSGEQIKSELAEISKDMNWRAKARDAFTNTADFLPFVGLNDSIASSQFDLDRATSVYRIAYEDTYRITRDPDMAKKKAKEVVTGRFGRTSINGDDQIMEFPPEKYYPIDNEDNEWMRNQMLTVAKEFMKGDITAGNLDERIKLVPDAYMTPLLAAQGRAGYNLVLMGEDGVPRKLNPDGEMFFFDPAQRKKEMVIEAKTERERKIKRLRSLSETYSGLD